MSRLSLQGLYLHTQYRLYGIIYAYCGSISHSWIESLATMLTRHLKKRIDAGA